MMSWQTSRPLMTMTRRSRRKVAAARMRMKRCVGSIWFGDLPWHRQRHCLARQGAGAGVGTMRSPWFLQMPHKSTFGLSGCCWLPIACRLAVRRARWRRTMMRAGRQGAAMGAACARRCSATARPRTTPRPAGAAASGTADTMMRTRMRATKRWAARDERCGRRAPCSRLWFGCQSETPGS